jgi:hypothetical protein
MFHNTQSLMHRNMMLQWMPSVFLTLPTVYLTKIKDIEAVGSSRERCVSVLARVLHSTVERPDHLIFGVDVREGMTMGYPGYT